MLVDHVGEREQQLHPVLRRLRPATRPRPSRRRRRPARRPRPCRAAPRRSPRRSPGSAPPSSRPSDDSTHSPPTNIFVLGHRHAHRVPPLRRNRRERIAARTVRQADHPVRIVVEHGRRCGSSSSAPAASAPRSRASRSGARSSSTARSPTTTSRGPRRVVAALDDGRFSAHRDRRVEPRRDRRADPRDAAPTPCSTPSTRVFNVPIFDACFEAGVTYLDMAMTLSEPHPNDPYEQTGVKLGDYQFERAAAWEEKGLLALVGIGIEPGAADVFARHAADELFSEIDEVGHPRRREPRRRGLRLRADVLDLDDDRGVPQPAGDLGAGSRLVHDRAVLRARGLRLPGGDRPGRVRQRRARGGAARPALGRLQARHLQVRARRRVHRRAARRCTSSGSTRRRRSASRASRSRRATSSPLRSPTRRRSATG